MYELRAVWVRVHAQRGHEGAQKHFCFVYRSNLIVHWALDVGIGERVRVAALDRVHFIYRPVPSYVESLESRLEKMDRLLSKACLDVHSGRPVPDISSASARRRCQPTGGPNGISCNTAL